MAYLGEESMSDHEDADTRSKSLCDMIYNW